MKIIRVKYVPDSNSEFKFFSNSTEIKPIHQYQDGLDIVAVEAHMNGVCLLNVHLNSEQKKAALQLDKTLSLIPANFTTNILLCGDLNIDLSNSRNIKILEDILNNNNFKISQVDIEHPVARCRSDEVAYNQQPSKGGVEKVEAKNIVLSLMRKQYSCEFAINSYQRMILIAAHPRIMEDDFLDHNPASLIVTNTLIVAFSNCPIQGPHVGDSSCILTDSMAHAADLGLRLEIVHLLSKQELLSKTRLSLSKFADEFNSNYRILQHEKFIQKWQKFLVKFLTSDALFTYMQFRINKGNVFQQRYAEIRNLTEDGLNVYIEKNFGRKQFPCERLEGATPEHPRADRLLNWLYEFLLSPQPNNGYKTPEIPVEKVEEYRLLKIFNYIYSILAEHCCINKIIISANDSRDEDYKNLLQLLAERLQNMQLRPHSYIENPLTPAYNSLSVVNKSVHEQARIKADNDSYNASLSLCLSNK